MRTSIEILEALVTINEFVIKGVPDQDIAIMLTTQSTLVTHLASTAALVAESGKLYNQAKTSAYHALKISSESQKEYWAPSLAKDYINGKLAEEFYVYEFAQRMNSAVTHALDACRTAISAEKQLLSNLNYHPA